MNSFFKKYFCWNVENAGLSSGLYYTFNNREYILFIQFSKLYIGISQKQLIVPFFRKLYFQLNTNTDGPCLAGHTATISGNLMIIYGGWDIYGSPFITRDLHILDLVAERWYTKRLIGGLST